MLRITSNVAVQAGVLDENAAAGGKQQDAAQQQENRRMPLQSVNARLQPSISDKNALKKQESQSSSDGQENGKPVFTSLSDQLRYSSLSLISQQKSQPGFSSSQQQKAAPSKETFSVFVDEAVSQPESSGGSSDASFNEAVPSTSALTHDDTLNSQNVGGAFDLELLAQMRPRTFVAVDKENNHSTSVCSPRRPLGDATQSAHHLDSVRKPGAALFDTTMESVRSDGSPMSIQSEPSAVKVPQRKPLSSVFSDESARTGFFDDDEDGGTEDAAFASVGTEGGAAMTEPMTDFSSTYYTAPPITEKQAHLDYVLAVPDYVDGLFDYLRHREQQQRPHADYMRKQTDLTQEMRAVLVDWIVDVGVEYQMQLETVFLTIRYVDLTLSSRMITRSRLQLVGTAACLLAAKYEEIYPPEVNEFVYITDDTYSRDEVLRMERSLLRDVLKFNCSLVTPLVFVTYFAKVCRTDGRTKQLALMLCELTLLDTRYMAFLPSQIGGAALCLANLMTGPIPWPEVLEEAAKMDITRIYPCMQLLLDSFKAAPDGMYRATVNKYSDPSHHSVALIEPPDEIPPLDAGS